MSASRLADSDLETADTTLLLTADMGPLVEEYVVALATGGGWPEAYLSARLAIARRVRHEADSEEAVVVHLLN